MQEFGREHRAPVKATEAGRCMYATRSRIRYGPNQIDVYETDGTNSSKSSSDKVSEEVLIYSNIGPRRSQEVLESLVCGRRLQMEYTYVQLNENNLQNALLSYGGAMQLPEHFPGRKAVILQTAGLVNHIRFSLGSASRELGDVLMQAVVTVTEGPQWGLMAPASLTPSGSIVALRERKLDRSIRFTTGFLAGKRLSVSQIQAMKEESSGGMLFMQPTFLAYGEHIIASGKKMQQLHSIGEMDEQLKQLVTNLVIEYWCLNQILCFTDYTSSEERCRRSLCAFKKLPLSSAVFSMTTAEWTKLMAWIGVSKEQFRKIVELRNSSKEKLDELETADLCLHDILSDIWSTQTMHGIDFVLNSVEAARKNNLAFERLAAEVAIGLMFGILTPLQTASLIVLVPTVSGQLICYWEDWILVFYNCIMTKWMDSYNPKP